MVWPGVAMAVMAIGPRRRTSPSLITRSTLARQGHNDVILRILAAHLAGLKPRNRLCTRDQGRAGRRLDRRNAADMVDMLMTGEQELDVLGSKPSVRILARTTRGFGGRSVDQNMAFVRRDQDHADPQVPT